MDTILVKDYRLRPFTDNLLRHQFVRDLPMNQHHIRGTIKDHIDRHRRVNKKDEGEYEYSGKKIFDCENFRFSGGRTIPEMSNSSKFQY